MSKTPKREVVHFHNGDYRFCGSTKKVRAFSFIDGDVTCPHCRQLSAEAVARFTLSVTSIAWATT